MESSRKLGSPHHSKSSATHGFFTLMILITSALFFFNFPASDHAASPSLTSTKTLVSRLHSASNYISSLSSIVASNARFLSGSCNYSAEQDDEEEEDVSSCDLFDGRWVEDDVSEPLYKPGSCPFIDDSFNCFKNGRPDLDFLRLRWKPSGCQLPRL